jgi:carbonic anhydrase
MPTVASWLGHAEATRRIIEEKYSELSEEELLLTAVQENVLVQLENLRTHPSVAAGLATGKLSLHGWLYEIESGRVYAYDPGKRQFQPIAEAARGFTDEKQAAIQTQSI